MDTTSYDVWLETEWAQSYSYALNVAHTCSLTLSNTNLLSVLLSLHLAPAASALQLLKSETLSSQFFECVPAGTTLSSSQDLLFPAGLPSHLTPSFLRITFSIAD